MPWKLDPPSDAGEIRKYLGHPVTDVSLSRINSQMIIKQSIGGEDVVLYVQELLLQLKTITNNLYAKRDVAAVADEAIADEEAPVDKSYYKGEAIKVLREEGRRLVKELAETLDLIVMRDVFSSAAVSRIVRG